MRDWFEKFGLLDKEPPEGYLEECTVLLTQLKEAKTNDEVDSVLIFRLQNEWMAIATSAVHDVVAARKIHHIPHRDNQTLVGTVNINGQLKLAISIEHILKIEKSSAEPYSKMIVIKQDDVEWAILVHDIFGVRPYQLNRMENVPVTVLKSSANFLKGIYQFDHLTTGILEEELLFFSLRREIG